MTGEGDGQSSEDTPQYLQTILEQVDKNSNIIAKISSNNTIPLLQEIRALTDRNQQYALLLLARHRLTRALAESQGLTPELVLQRASVYEALGYSDLALADAYVSYTLCEVVLEGPHVSDLEPAGPDGEPWPKTEDTSGVLAHKYQSLILLCRSALLLGCQHQAKIWIDDLLALKNSLQSEEKNGGADISSQDAVVADFCDFFSIYGEDGSFRQSVSESRQKSKPALYGWSQRQVYPWNGHEPDRMSKEALKEINDKLHEAAEDLEVEISVLPNLVTDNGVAPGTNESSTPAESWSQLGLYAKKDLAPGATILKERSVLTAIRPHGEALCDACAADMEGISQEDRHYCAGCDIPFCSEACSVAAREKYHTPNGEDEETDEGYPPAETPFCPGSSGNEDLHTLGRAESSTTPEWDLYFLLLSRAMQMSETQGVHPLDLFEVKYLWGDLSPGPSPSNLFSHSGPKTLPYSVRHHVELPLQWFEVLMHSRAGCRPYSAEWLEKYDWWILQTLFAKFRGVADAQQSTWTGKAEVAAVHPLWCLANHSCNPNVTWQPSGVRNFTVMTERVWQRPDSKKDDQWTGIKAGEEIWNHYTDIHEPDFRERRARLKAVLGGDCRCERCTDEESIAK